MGCLVIVKVEDERIRVEVAPMLRLVMTSELLARLCCFEVAITPARPSH